MYKILERVIFIAEWKAKKYQWQKRRNKYHTIEMLHKSDLSSHLTNCQIWWKGNDEKSYSASKLEVQKSERKVDERTMICIFCRGWLFSPIQQCWPLSHLWTFFPWIRSVKVFSHLIVGRHRKRINNLINKNLSTHSLL